MKNKNRQSKRLDDGDRLPPHASETEAALLGACLSQRIEVLNACEEAGVTSEWFYEVGHQEFWLAINALHHEGKTPDVTTVWHWLKQDLGQDLAPEVFAGLSVLPDRGVPGLYEQYLEDLRELTQARALIREGTRVARALNEGEIKAAPALDQLDHALSRLRDLGQSQAEQSIRQALPPVMDEMDNYHRGRAQIQGLTTGIDYVDKTLCGLGGDNGNYIVISARPGIGKTSLALQIAMHACFDYVWFDPVLDEKGQEQLETIDGKERIKCQRRVGVPVGIFSMEMASRALVKRMLFQRAEADLQRFRTGFAESQDWPGLAQAAAQLLGAGKENQPTIWVDDEPRVSIDRLKAKAKRWHRQYGIKLFIIDYIQLLRASGKRFREDRVQELSEISGEIQSLGKDLNVPFIVLAQMNRDYEKEITRRPRLSDLKDCGSIEQDADLVGFLFAPKLKDKDKDQYEATCERVFGGEGDWSKWPKRVDLLWAKNRYGPSGVVNQLLFQKSCTKFFDWVQWQKSAGTREMAMGEKSLERGAGSREPEMEPEPEPQGNGPSNQEMDL